MLTKCLIFNFIKFMENIENKAKSYKEERFEFTIYVNDNIICKRNFNIYNFLEDKLANGEVEINSIGTQEFLDAMDTAVRMIKNDLASKSRVYLWYQFNPDEPSENEELLSPLIEPWACTFKFVLTDNKREVYSKIWDGYAYPKYIREKVDLNNKYVKVTTKDGQTFSYEKESFFNSNKGRLTFEQEMLKSMMMDKQDVLAQITRTIREACSPSKADIKKTQKGYYDSRDAHKYLSHMTTIVDYGKDKNGKRKFYSMSLPMSQFKIYKDWEISVAKKTEQYMKELY